MYLNLHLMRSFIFLFFAGEWVDLGEHNYRIFGRQFSELERVAIDLSQGRSPEKTRFGVMKGRLGALRFYGCLCREPYYTQESHCGIDRQR